MPPGSGEAVFEAAKRRRKRCAPASVLLEGLPLARTLRDVAVRDPLTRSIGRPDAGDPPSLDSVQIGQLTTPDVTPQGCRCSRSAQRKRARPTPAKRELREQMFTKRFEAESKKYLDDIRKRR